MQTFKECCSPIDLNRLRQYRAMEFRQPVTQGKHSVKRSLKQALHKRLSLVLRRWRPARTIRYRPFLKHQQFAVGSLFTSRNSSQLSLRNVSLIKNPAILPINNPALLYYWLKIKISSLFHKKFGLLIQPRNGQLLIRIWKKGKSPTTTTTKSFLGLWYYVTRSQKGVNWAFV